MTEHSATTRPALHRYVSDDEDSSRWDDFRFRPGDIVISTRSKSGTTWMQMICALLIFGDTELPAPLAELSPWLDHRITSIHEVQASLEQQPHRRFIKTHTPLDGLPSDSRVTYIVVARHPLDAAVSLYHQGANLDRQRIAELSGITPPNDRVRLPLEEWLVDWIEWDGPPEERLDSLVGFAHHVTGAWARRAEPNVLLVHFADLSDDLVGQMLKVSRALGVGLSASEIEALAPAATFDAMRERSARHAPDAGGVLRSTDAFFRRGRSGDGMAALGEAALRRYHERLDAHAPAEVAAWLNR